MRRIALFAALAAALAAALVSCNTKPQHMISGNLQTAESDWLLFIYGSDGDSGEMAMDTVYLDNGKFHYDPPVAETGTVMMVEVKHFIDNISLYLVPGEQAVISGTMTDYKIGGSPFYEDWGRFHEITRSVDKARYELMASIPEEEDPDYDMAAYSAKDRAIKQEWDRLALQFIKDNPESDLCAYLAHELSRADDFYDAEETISEKVKKGRLGFLIERKVLAMDADAVRQASAKDVFVGAVAPDFSLPTSTGGTFTLSEYRGRYVLLDFWGTWCHWCIEGLPTVKTISNSFADRLTVVSVDTGDPKGAWLDGIKQYGMDWVQVYNSREDAIDAKYAVQGFPGFYLIDPEGVIKMMEFGEPAHFVEKIGELISQ